MSKIVKLNEQRSVKNLFEPLILTLVINEEKNKLKKQFSYNPIINNGLEAYKEP